MPPFAGKTRSRGRYPGAILPTVRRYSPRKDALTRHYLLIGLGAAVIVAAVIVAAGAASGDGGASDSGTATQALPPGHPTIAASTSAAGKDPGSGTLLGTIAQLQKATAADPHDASLLLRLGDACVLSGRYHQAERAYEGALADKPGDPTATVRLAMVWHAEGQTKRATSAIDAVLARDPGQQEAHYSLAIILFSQNDIGGAKSEWSAAASIDPHSTIGRRSQSFVDLLEGKQSSSPESGGGS